MVREKRQPKFLLKKSNFSVESPEALSDADNSLGWLNSHIPKRITIQKLPPKKTKLNNVTDKKESAMQTKLSDSGISKNKSFVEYTKNKKFLERITLEQRIAYVSNVLSSFPAIWCLYDTVSNSSFDDLENSAYEGAYPSAKEFAKAITNLIANERDCIFADTSLASERLLSFRSIKKQLLKVQNVLHGFDGPTDVSYLEPLSESLDSLDFSKLLYSENNKYVNMQIADDVTLQKYKFDRINQVTFNALHSPVFKLIKSVGQDGYAWSEGSIFQVVRLYIASNRSRLTAASKDPQSLCLLDVRLGFAPYNASLVVKPFGNCYEVLDEGNFTLDSPVGWIWAAVLSIDITPHSPSRGNKLHVPATFNKVTTQVAKSTHRFISEWFEKRNTVLSPESVAF